MVQAEESELAAEMRGEWELARPLTARFTLGRDSRLV
jgi:hypothetical protein